jgi:hypothetical protein
VVKPKRDFSAAPKMLLLGAADTGKSTLFTQFLAQFEGGIDRADALSFIPAIRFGLVSGIKALAREAKLAPELQAAAAAMPDGGVAPLTADAVAVVKRVWESPAAREEVQRKAPNYKRVRQRPRSLSLPRCPVPLCLSVLMVCTALGLSAVLCCGVPSV